MLTNLRSKQTSKDDSGVLRPEPVFFPGSALFQNKVNLRAYEHPKSWADLVIRLLRRRVDDHNPIWIALEDLKGGADGTLVCHRHMEELA